METHSRILAWRIPWTEEPGGYSPEDCEELDMTEHAHIVGLAFVLMYIWVVSSLQLF